MKDTGLPLMVRQLIFNYIYYSNSLNLRWLLWDVAQLAVAPDC